MRTLLLLAMAAFLHVADPAIALRRRAFRALRARAALIAALALAALSVLSGCGVLGSPEARMANAIANGAACGYAAANGTPCTPEEVLHALASDARAQRAKVEAVVPQAAAADPALTQRLVEELERNTSSNEALVKAILLLATRAAPEAPNAPPAPSPSPAPAPAPSSTALP